MPVFYLRMGSQMVGLLFVVILVVQLGGAEPALTSSLQAIRSVGKEGKGHGEAVKAMAAANRAPASELVPILTAMDGASDLASNWLRSAAEAVAQRGSAGGGKLPLADLEKFLADTKHSPRARRLAFEILATAQPEAAARLTGSLLNDPSLELRRDAVAQLLAVAAEQEKAAPAAAIPSYRKAFTAARDLDQIQAASAKLKELKEDIDLALHMGYLQTWHLVGPFDNVDDKGWNVAYPPEEKVDLAASYEGVKGDMVKWTTHTTENEYGEVDLNKVLANHKGAITYAFTDFVSDKDQEVDFRLGCINATKVWVNGKLLAENHVYHAGMEVDQYNFRGTLKKGKNQILIKVCQNEQKEGWAQRWQFQLRVCDSIGTAILSADRPSTKTASLALPVRR